MEAREVWAGDGRDVGVGGAAGGGGGGGADGGGGAGGNSDQAECRRSSETRREKVSAPQVHTEVERDGDKQAILKYILGGKGGECKRVSVREPEIERAREREREREGEGEGEREREVDKNKAGYISAERKVDVG